jgi:hypothetical protein
LISKIAAAVSVLIMADAAQAASIVPHRAIYDLKIKRLAQGSGLASVEGRLAFEVQGSTCEGWTVSFRMINRYKPSEGAIKMVDVQSTSYESGDGLEMRYSEREFLNSAQDSESRIKVSRTSLETEGEGQEGEKTFSVPAGTVFPMQHQLRLMKIAESGGNRDSSVVYDGSDGEKFFNAVAFIGNRVAAGQNDSDAGNAIAKPLGAFASWPMSISYYQNGSSDDLAPSYQVSFDLYENGIATGLMLDYGEFALDGRLANLELLPGSECK